MPFDMTLSTVASAKAEWLALIALGAFHGINPGMGWLFAVALGMQERRRGAVLRALVPLGVGHALAVAAAVGLAFAIGTSVSQSALRWPVAGLLVSLGIVRYFHHWHPRWVGMRVGMGGLTMWSFLMASAHGAGLMVVPVLLGMSMADARRTCAPRRHRGGHHCNRRVGRDGRARGELPGGDRIRRRAGVREARCGDPAPRLVEPRSDLGGRIGGQRSGDAGALNRNWQKPGGFK